MPTPAATSVDVPVQHRPRYCAQNHRIPEHLPARVVATTGRRTLAGELEQHELLEVLCPECGGGPARGTYPWPAFPARVDVRALFASSPPPYDYVLPALPLGKAGIFVGPGGSGKSKLMYLWAVGIALGRNLAWAQDSYEPAAPAGVLILSAEDDKLDIWHRFFVLAAELALSEDEVELLVANLDIRCVPGWRLADEGLPGELAEWIVNLAPSGTYRLILGDPLARLCALDENDQRHATRLIETIEAVARQTLASFVVAHHVSKGSMRGDQLDEAHAARGAAGFTDGCRWQANCGLMTPTMAAERGVSDAERIKWLRVTIAKCNYAARPTPTWLRFQPGGALVLSAEPALANPATGGGRRGNEYF